MTPSKPRGRLASALVAVALLAGPVAAWASSQPLIEPERVQLQVRGIATPDAAAMRRIVVEGGASHGWQVVSDEPGRVVLRVRSDAHSATVGVSYDAAGFQIRYQDSAAMDYELDKGQAVINPRYNKWVIELGNGIRRAAGNGVYQRPRAASAASSPSR